MSQHAPHCCDALHHGALCRRRCLVQHSSGAASVIAQSICRPPTVTEQLRPPAAHCDAVVPSPGGTLQRSTSSMCVIIAIPLPYRTSPCHWASPDVQTSQIHSHSAPLPIHPGIARPSSCELLSTPSFCVCAPPSPLRRGTITTTISRPAPQEVW
jgi:hypothetical protein